MGATARGAAATPSAAPPDDFHFYYTPQADVEAIALGPCSRTGFLSPGAWRAALRPIPLNCFPTGYTNGALAVAGMGNHLVRRGVSGWRARPRPRNPRATLPPLQVNLAGPEFELPFHGFGQSLIFGAHDGRVTFVEVMASSRWLAANAAAGAALCFPITGGPARYLVGGLKPSTYCLEPLERTTRVRFGGFAHHAPSPECNPDAPGAVYDPASYAPAVQEAEALNRACVADRAPPPRPRRRPPPGPAPVFEMVNAPESLAERNGRALGVGGQGEVAAGLLKAAVG